MKVSSDFKSFHFADSNSRFDDVCVEDLWTNLNYYGVDKIYNGGIQTLKMKSRMAASAYQEDEQGIRRRFRYQQIRDSDYKMKKESISNTMETITQEI